MTATAAVTHLLVRIERGAAQAFCGLTTAARDATVDWTLRLRDASCPPCLGRAVRYGWSDQRTLGATG